MHYYVFICVIFEGLIMLKDLIVYDQKIILNIKKKSFLICNNDNPNKNSRRNGIRFA